MAENLALDEALLDEAEAAGRPLETLRFWEPPAVSVVVGRSSQIAREVRIEVCRQLGIPLLRRPSGGAAIVTGPGCLMYAVVLSRRSRNPLDSVAQVHRFVLGTLAAALRRLLPEVSCQGISDLAFAGRKFSGNSLRLRREHLLYHGTVLYEFPLHLLERCLTMPPRQPEYRDGRPHDQFVTNLPLPSAAIRAAIAAAWDAREQLIDWPEARTAQLADEKYSSRQWNESP